MNELSLPVELHEDRVTDLLEQFTEIIVAAKGKFQEIALLNSGVLFESPALQDGKSLAVYAMSTGGRLRDKWRLVLQMAQKGALPVDGATTVADQDYSHLGRAAIGLASAARANEVALSLASHDAWSSAWVDVEVLSISEDQGDLIEHEGQEQVRHAATLDHLDIHEDHIRRALMQEVSAEDLWAYRKQLFPHILFLARVESDLLAYKSGTSGIHQIHERLMELDRGCAEWARSKEASPVWGLNVTPEHEHRKRLAAFTDADGETRIFDTHVRFTPNAGRIHFRLGDRSAWPQLVVAYVGPKL